MKRIAFFAALVLALDQLSKWLVVHWLNLAQVGWIEVFPPYLVLNMAWNRGINFGFMSEYGDATRWVLIGVALTIVALVLWWMRKETRAAALVSAGLLVGGALGNVIDRLIYGAVADFLNMSCCGIDNPFAFNFADVAIFVGAFGLILFSGEKKTP